MQTRLLSSVSNESSTSSQVGTAFFVGGLLADMFGAILSFDSAGWFEMLIQEEATHLHQCWVGAETGQIRPGCNSPLKERWVSVSIQAGPYAVILGLTLFVFGVMVMVWAQQPAVVKGVATAACLVFVALITSFAIKHNRKVVLEDLRLKR